MEVIAWLWELCDFIHGLENGIPGSWQSIEWLHNKSDTGQAIVVLGGFVGFIWAVVSGIMFMDNLLNWAADIEE